jgi:glutamate synthase (NADPH/NADH) large chain
MTRRMTLRQARQRHAALARAAAKRAAAKRSRAAPKPPGLYDRRLDHDSCGVGFIADLRGGKSHKIIEYGLQILENLTHRGAVGADPLVGDGAGILVQVPHDFLREECAALGFALPESGDYGVGFIFMPQDETRRRHYEAVV